MCLDIIRKWFRKGENENKPLQMALLADDLAGLDYPYVIDLNGNLVTDPAQYIHDVYGAAVAWQRAEPHPDGDWIFRLVGFAEWMGGSATMWAFCIDRENASPLMGTPMIRWWPDAPTITTPILEPASAWHTAGIVAWVKETGLADWGVGRGEAYFPQVSSGPCEVWVCSLDGPSDLMQGWGWLDGTQYRQLRPIFERVAVEHDDDDDDDENGGDGEDLAAVVAELHGIREALEEFVSWLKR